MHSRCQSQLPLYTLEKLQKLEKAQKGKQKRKKEKREEEENEKTQRARDTVGDGCAALLGQGGHETVHTEGESNLHYTPSVGAGGGGLERRGSSAGGG